MQIKKITKQSIAEAVEILKAGGIVVYPTETAYALGCDATDKIAKKRIFKIKNRPVDKNLPMICATKKMAFDFFKFGKIEKNLAQKYWPGPLSIVLSPCHCEESATRQSHQYGIATPSEGLAMTADGVPVRISSNKIACALSRGLHHPIISTSANVSGKKTLYEVKEIIREFKNKKYQPASTRACLALESRRVKRGEPASTRVKRGEPDLILDAGKLPKRPPSTIIKIENEKVIVVRQGEIKICPVRPTLTSVMPCITGKNYPKSLGKK